jgi:tripartite-type tricarboxylate transporter receptor subunit TctC
MVAALAMGVVAASGGLPGGGAPAQPAAFPGGRPITLIVPYAAGGTTDAGARLLAARLEDELKTRVQVANRPGAASQAGLQALLASPPTGHTLSYAVLPTVITHYSDPGRQAPYARQDFQPVAHHHLIPAMVAVLADSPHRTLKDLVEAARANPGKVSISDSALLGNPHLTVLMLQRAAGVRFASVHFDGGAPSVTALLGGHVDAVAGGISDAVPHVRAGRFRVLGIAAEQESEFLPGVPTMKAQGYDVVSVSATGLVAPAATPREVVDALSAAIRRVVESDEHRQKLTALGVSPRYLDPEAYAAFWASYEARVAPVLKELRATQ